MRLSASLIAILMLLGVCGCGGSSSTSAPETQNPANPQQPEPPQPPQPEPPAPPEPPEPPEPEAETIIRVLALHSNGATAMFPQIELRIAHLLNVANEVMSFSAATVAFELAHTEAVPYPDGVSVADALDAVTNASHPAFTDVARLRDQHQADLVVLFQTYANEGLCGYAWIGGYQTNGDFSHPAEANFGFSVVAIDCSDFTLLHELGHNLGLAHSRREDPVGGSFVHGVGHGLDNDFVTIMASATEFNARQLPLMSSPALICNLSPCGVEADDAVNGADAVLAINAVKDQVAAYR